MLGKIKKYLVQNGYSGDGLREYLDRTGSDKRYHAQWCASETSKRSGIISYRGVRYYFYAIAPWAYCPAGLVTVEVMR